MGSITPYHRALVVTPFVNLSGLFIQLTKQGRSIKLRGRRMAPIHAWLCVGGKGIKVGPLPGQISERRGVFLCPEGTPGRIPVVRRWQRLRSGARTLQPAPPPAAVSGSWLARAGLVLHWREVFEQVVQLWSGLRATVWGQGASGGGWPPARPPSPAPGFRRYLSPQRSRRLLGRWCPVPSFPLTPNQPRRPLCVKMWRWLCPFPTY